MDNKKFIPLTNKINGFLISILFLGIGLTTFWLARDLFITLDEDSETSMEIQTEILYQAIENAMIAGKADLAVDFFEDISQDIPQFEVTLFRNNGTPAFSDTSTIDMVNKNLGTPMFSMEDQRLPASEEPNTESFEQALKMTPDPVFMKINLGEQTHYQVYRAFLNLPGKCIGCHGPLPTVRGVLGIRSDISDVVATQKLVLFRSFALFLIMMIALSLLLTQYMKRSVIRPVQIIGEVCDNVTQGVFSNSIEKIQNDEIGLLGLRVNTMVEGLKERFELSKFVSTHTINNLGSKDTGEKVDITLFFSDIRGFTSYSENNPPEKVVQHLNRILNFQTEVIHSYGGDIDKYVGDEIVAVFTGTEGEKRACEAAREIQKQIIPLKEELDDLRVGIGINYGPTIMGMIGSEKRADFTSIGETVNVASRLCSSAKANQILVSESVFQRVKNEFPFKGPYGLTVKGISRKLKVYLMEAHA